MSRVEVYRDQFEELAGPFQKWPSLPCLVCHRGALEMVTISEFESKASADARVGVEIEEGPRSGFFHGELACSQPSCGSKYVVAGEWTRGTDDPDEETDSLDIYDPSLFGLTVRHILPPLPLIALPEGTPEPVKVLVESCSSVLLSDPNAASGRIRTAIEAVLDQQKIQKTGNSRAERLGIHARLNKLAEKNGPAATHLIAMKWIGNEGTHEREPVPLRSVLDGLELFARGIEILYDPREARLARMAALINKKHDDRYERLKAARRGRRAVRRGNGSGSGRGGSSTTQS